MLVTDPETSEVGQAIYEEGGQSNRQDPARDDALHTEAGEGFYLPVADIMRKNRGVIIIATKDSLTHTRARQQASKEGARIVSMPGIGRDSFEKGGMTADHNALQREISGMGVIFRRKRLVKVSTPLEPISSL